MQTFARYKNNKDVPRQKFYTHESHENALAYYASSRQFQLLESELLWYESNLRTVYHPSTGLFSKRTWLTRQRGHLLYSLRRSSVWRNAQQEGRIVFWFPTRLVVCFCYWYSNTHIFKRGTMFSEAWDTSFCKSLVKAPCQFDHSQLWAAGGDCFGLIVSQVCTANKSECRQRLECPQLPCYRRLDTLVQDEMPNVVEMIRYHI